MHANMLGNTEHFLWVLDSRGTVLISINPRELPLPDTTTPALAAALPAPFFITLDAQRAQADPMLGFASPWLQVPRTVLCNGDTTKFTIAVPSGTVRIIP